ncbi:hypothetical protein Q7P37_010095 [Cladosporium fusiforme]
MAIDMTFPSTQSKTMAFMTTTPHSTSPPLDIASLAPIFTPRARFKITCWYHCTRRTNSLQTLAKDELRNAVPSRTRRQLPRPRLARKRHQTPTKHDATTMALATTTTIQEALEPKFLTMADRIKQGRRKPPQQQASLPTMPMPKPQQVKRRKLSPDDAVSVATTTTEETTKSAPTKSAPTEPSVSSTPQPADARPANDVAGNREFVSKVIKALRVRIKPSKDKMYGDRTNKVILRLLEKATAANDTEMLFLSGSEAAKKLSTGVFHNGPLLTEGQQPMPLQTIPDFLGEYYDDDMRVFVQDPSTVLTKANTFTKNVTIGAVKKRLLGGKTKGRPWNCLELATHVEDGLRPLFLSGEDARLLSKVKLEHDRDGDQSSAGRRSYPQGYKEVEKWALLAEAGALTEPHQDSHGYSTYITVNQGLVGFGWLSYPSDEERTAWIQDTTQISPDRFRYVVLHPGQTVYFPAGTVHFVFREPHSGHTLAMGGHVLRNSNIVHWLKCLLEEKANTNITNEDLTSSAPGYINSVEKFVKQAQATGTTDKWGGPDACEEFLRLKAKFMAS